MAGRAASLASWLAGWLAGRSEVAAPAAAPHLPPAGGGWLGAEQPRRPPAPLPQVIAALSLILAKLVREGVAPLSPKSKPPPSPAAASEPPRLLLKLLVPQPLCGIIIGKSGVTIRNCAQETRTAIRVNAVEGAGPLSEAYRIVTVAGPQECVLKAIALLVLKQSEDQKFPLFAELPSAAHVPMGMHPGMAMPGVPPHMLHAMGGYGLPRGGMPYMQMGPGGGMYGPPGGAGMYGPHGGGDSDAERRLPVADAGDWRDDVLPIKLPPGPLPRRGRLPGNGGDADGHGGPRLHPAAHAAAHRGGGAAAARRGRAALVEEIWTRRRPWGCTSAFYCWVPRNCNAGLWTCWPGGAPRDKRRLQVWWMVATILID